MADDHLSWRVWLNPIGPEGAADHGLHREDTEELRIDERDTSGTPPPRRS